MNGHGEAPLVAVIATGGTIASRRGADGASTPSLSGEDLLALVPQINARLKPIDLMAKDSSSLTLADMQRISDAVGVELNDPAVTGVVVLHGTDAMEESSLLVHVQHAITKPVVFTGAQFTADHPNADGPSNLAAAIETALDQANAERGVLLSFGGRCLPAWGLYKLSADAADAFRSARPAAHAAALDLTVPLADLRVDIVAIYPGCDAAHIEASLQAGADGIVLAALGSGNANPGIAVAVKRCAERGVPVVVSSRVPEGLLVASYGGGGGGHDLVAAGAIHSSTLRPGQARILLAALIAANSPAEKIVSAFKDGSLS
ncbi:asparaginase [Agrobacterium tumefaciens]|uniref:asparaginase n=1 Tax=Agrobacterium tumefaciens TaxID=358 RepID=UPI001574EC8B|nr:asparaginase [Agrobacterium tumefaciens]NSZ65085.1 asparaginase [Agrobacterium tumefaciens]NTA71456.1 asparaginase [Agrobacterium tumefaciens]WIE40308.1 asparaginase [Agrobacterium tumefaciens]